MMILIAGGLAVLAILFLVLSCMVSYKASKDADAQKEAGSYLKIGIAGFLVLILASGISLWAIPMYKVWQKGKDGEAALAEATANRQILIQEASAKEEAAKHLAEAEIIRSRGISQANEIVSESLKGNSMYLQYLYIQSLKESQNKVIYVPITSQGLPLLESARFIDDHYAAANERMQEYLESKEEK